MSQHNPNGDLEVVSPPNDSISALAFSPKANFFSSNIMGLSGSLLGISKWNYSTQSRNIT